MDKQKSYIVICVYHFQRLFLSGGHHLKTRLLTEIPNIISRSSWSGFSLNPEAASPGGSLQGQTAQNSPETRGVTTA
jgi:hypothetical protein